MRLHPPRETAEILQVSTATVRRWSLLWAEHLSEYASPTEPGARRKYTEDDIAVLQYASRLMDSGHSLDEVGELLKVAPAEDLRPPPKELEPVSETAGTSREIALPFAQMLEIASAQSRQVADQAERISRQDAEIADQRARIADQADQLIEASERLAELEARLKAIEERERPPGLLERLFGSG